MLRKPLEYLCSLIARFLCVSVCDGLCCMIHCRTLCKRLLHACLPMSIGHLFKLLGIRSIRLIFCTMLVDSTGTQQSHKGRTACMHSSPDITPDVSAFHGGCFVCPVSHPGASQRAFVNQSIVVPKHHCNKHQQQELVASPQSSPSQMSDAILLSSGTSAGFEKMPFLRERSYAEVVAQPMSLRKVCFCA